ncbi:ATP synthase subunit gamma, mitochondrial isoform X1 [Diaphorina citri]|uniref:ATP synthase subunit gamma n=2 Tax=Diaphorina citri TaxID=121845 RepID=A0A1S4ECU0_DIACI|nr:ATP synthase subunit gamma, mitochondrial isoform X2 [Diaphorina citri]XP_017299902.1 ATP synthase subunit gamma, mitochondrial isoform X1 [Diaphorina citri]KAI5716653.1 hypothetical protein M8J76_010045 [Diaphorina citri]
MFSKTALLVPQCMQQQTRNMATLKAISIRLKSVKNIQKITQSMKMVSAAKYTRAERELKAAKPIGAGASAFYSKAEVTTPEGTESPKELLIAVTSDRGLCGAVHTSVARWIRNELQTKGDKVLVITIGDKSRAILQRLYGNNIILAANEVGRRPPTFLDASKVAQETSKYNFTSGKIIYNKFKSVVSYTTSDLPIFSLASVTAAPKLGVYDSLDADVIQSYLEFSMAAMLYYAMKEGACSEQSSRMTSMDNASKNAGEMIEKLTLTFNRTRQAVITRELIEIISGASAL